MAGNLDEVTDNNFQAEVIEADKPVLVDFWAPWCGPCRIIAPHLEELQSERDDLRIVKLNVDENPQTAAQYNVMSIPTLLLFKNGQPVHQIIGAMPKNRLVQELEPALGCLGRLEQPARAEARPRIAPHQRRQEDERALRVGQVRLRLVVRDLVAEQDEAAEDEPADRPRTSPSSVRGARCRRGSRPRSRSGRP